MGATAIPYCTRTYNLAAGCDQHGGPACAYCWSARLCSTRLRHHPRYRGLAKDGKWTGEIRVFPDLLDEPRHWRGRQVVFVAPHSDFFLLPLAAIAAGSEVMADCPQHTFLVVTHHAWALEMYLHACGWSLPDNCYLLATAEDQERADKILPVALRTGARVMANLEPMLGPIELYDYFDDPGDLAVGAEPTKGVVGVILGGCSGPGAPPCDVAWIRDVVRQCKAAGVPCYVKQLGARPYSNVDHISHRSCAIKQPDGFYRFLRDRAGADPDEWPDDLRVRELPWRMPRA